MLKQPKIHKSTET